MKAAVIGLSGPSAAGKTTLAHALRKSQTLLAHSATVISTDDYYYPPLACPRFDLEGLPWQRKIPAAFAARGNADMNVPDAVDWVRVIADLDAKREQQRGPIIIDSLLLFGDHPGALQVLERCDEVAVLWADGSCEHSMRTLQTRKMLRSRSGPSYQQRGVTEEEYRVYWEHYVWPRWEQHGASRAPSGALRIDCLEPTAAQLDEVIQAGWLPTTALPRRWRVPPVRSLKNGVARRLSRVSRLRE